MSVKISLKVNTYNLENLIINILIKILYCNWDIKILIY